MTDVLLNPTFPEDELQKIKKQTISGLQANKEDPDAIASNVAQVLRYGNHPYGELTTEETVSNIEVEIIQNYYNTYFKPNISYLAIVGDINLNEAEELAKEYFAKWEKGEVPEHNYEKPKVPENSYVALVDRSQAVQSVISLTYPVNLKPGAPDVIPARVMNTILGGGFSSNLMQNLRETHGFTYGVRSSLRSNREIGSFSASASVRNDVTDSSIVEFLHELNKIRTEKVSDEQLRSIKNYISGGFARSLESPQTIANFALNIERYGLPKNYYADYLKNIDAVTVEDVKNMAEKYITPENAYILVVGKASEVSDKLKQFGEIINYDIYGKEYDPAKTTIPEGITAASVIDSYLTALGGKEALQKINDIKMEMKAEAMGQEMIFSTVRKLPNKLLLEVKMGPSIVNKVISDGKKISALQMGQPVPMDEIREKDQLIESHLFPELMFDELEVKTELLSIENIDGRDAYAVEVTFPTGTKLTAYFDTESGLKVRSSKTLEGPQGSFSQTTDFKDYKSVKGVKFAHTIIQFFGPQKITTEVTSLLVNSGVKDDLFKVE